MVLLWNKNLPHKDLFNYYISKMKWTGILDRILKKYLAKSHSECKSSSAFISITLDNVLAAFAIDGTGLILAICILIIEIFVYKSSPYIKRLGISSKIMSIFCLTLA